MNHRIHKQLLEVSQGLKSVAVIELCAELVGNETKSDNFHLGMTVSATRDERGLVGTWCFGTQSTLREGMPNEPRRQQKDESLTDGRRSV